MTNPLTLRDREPSVLFEPEGPCLIVPEALSRRWSDAVARRWAARMRPAADERGYPLPYALAGDVAVVSVDGPLMQRGGGYYFDGFDAVTERVKAALDDSRARAVVLKLNSPGGMAAGCFEASRQMRAMAQASGKPLFAYADEMACSAAYALACAASVICLPPSGEVGSIGVLSAVVSMKRGLEADGVDAVVVRSGAMKASGHPFDALSDDAIAREQADVDALAAQFFALVSAARGLAPEAVAALQGDTRLGPAAVAAGLADAVCTFEECVARAASAPRSTPALAPITRGSQSMDQKLSDLIAAKTGQTDPERQFGALQATFESAAKTASLEASLATLEKERADEKAAADKSERDAAFEAAVKVGADAGKLTPAMAETWRAQYAAGEVSTKVLEGHLTAAPVIAALSPEHAATRAKAAPAAGGSPKAARLAELTGKSFASMTWGERSELQQLAPDAYAREHEAWTRAGCPGNR